LAQNLHVRPRLGILAVLGLAGAALLASLTCARIVGRGPLVIAYDDLPMTLDPHLHNESIVWNVLCNFYDGLVTMTPEMRVAPGLAVAWRQTSPTTWRLTLREGVRFSNGDPFTAADVIASFERARNHPRSAARYHFIGVSGMRPHGDLGLEIETAAPAPDLINRLAFLFVVPRRDAGDAEIARPVGTGPYRFVDRAADGSIRAEAWASWRGVAEVRRVRLLFFQGPKGATLQRLFGGAVDVMTGVDDNQLGEFEGRAGVRLVPQPRLAVQLIAIASHAAQGVAGRALADLRVRRALLLGLNRPAWVNRVYRGNATVASQYVHPVVLGYDPSLQPEPFDPITAKRLLAEAGYADGFEAQLGFGQGLPAPFVEAVRDDLARIGLRIIPRQATFGELVRLARSGELPLFFYAWACTTGDASDFLNSSLHSRDEREGLGNDNYSGFSSPEVDALLTQAEAEMVPQRRLELLRRAQRTALASLPVLPLTIRWGYVGVSDRVDIVTRHDQRLWLAAFHWRR
jgi:peptide/nickel transport system substrate-binding protein